MSRSLFLPLAFAACLAAASSSFAQAPLHQRIDQALAAKNPNFAAQAAPAASDAEFLRRVYLDLTGTIPTTAELRAFLADNAADKRTKLIDKLLASQEHFRHMAHVFDVLFMERRPDKFIKRDAWIGYLRQAFQENRPWDELVREILGADGFADEHRRPPAKFYLDRAAEPHLLTKDISRLFLGMNLQCAQCHDHPRVKQYLQDDYYGIYAFLNRTTIFTDPKTKLVSLAEKADGDVTYQSVFDPNKLTKTAAPKMVKAVALKDPDLPKGAEYVVAPAKDVRPVPKYSRRAQLAGQLTDAANVPFRRNIANRLWAHMMGRGIVHPLDMDHPGNPPSHPELLDLLAEEIGTMKFDMRAFVRELALSAAYQRSSELLSGVADAAPDSYLAMNLKPLSAEQFAFSILQATGQTAAERLALGDKAVEMTLYQKMAPSAATVVGMFAGPSGQAETFEATLNQAFFIANGKVLRGWLAARNGSLMDRLMKLKDDGEVAEELYLSILSRPPSAEEKKEIAELLKVGERGAALREVAWALLASAEFRFNH